MTKDFSYLPAQLVTVSSVDALRDLANADGVTSISLPRSGTLSASSDQNLIKQPQAQAAGYTGSGVRVAVIDTGVDWTDSRVNGAFGDCSGGAGTGTCRIDTLTDVAQTGSRDVDPGRHGTNVSGIVVATAPGAHLDVYNVFNLPDSRGNVYFDEGYLLAALNAITRNAAERNIRAVNMSLGFQPTYASEDCSNGTENGPEFSSAYSSAFLNLRAVGVVPVVAAGNKAEVSGSFQQGIGSPACATGAISVGAVYDRNVNVGPTSDCPAARTSGDHVADEVACFSQTGDNLSLLAPGVQITGAGITESGTSQAAPHVAGAVADLVNANPRATTQQIIRALTTTGTPVTDRRPTPAITRNRLDIAAAAEAVKAPLAGVADPGCLANILPANDDGSTDAVTLPFAANFFGTTYSGLFVNNNGNVTFRGPLSTYTPFTLAADTPPIIAPFLADVDTRGVGSSQVTYGTTTFGSRTAFCVNWNNVGYYSGHDDKLNSFQLLLVDRGDLGAGDFDIVMNYDALTWETGDASGGANGMGGTPAGAGYSAGDGVATHFVQFDGSLTHNGLLDSNRTGLVNRSTASVQVGRHIFAVRNGAPPGAATVTGTVSDNNGSGVAAAPVQACPSSGGSCAVGFTGSDGRYSIVGLNPGRYDLTARPPAGSDLLPGRASGIVVATNSTVRVDLALTGPSGPPSGTTITNRGTSGGLPVIYWTDPLTLTTTACAGGTAGYTVTVGDQTLRSGTMTEGPAGRYSAAVPALYPTTGVGTVRITVNCPGNSTPTVIEFSIYIDPSGTVVNTNGAPVSGATVTLLRGDTASGPFNPVPDGSAIMSPSARTNPQTTVTDGIFHWDVIPGYYRVSATKAGCRTADGGGDTAVSPVYEVPPPAIDLQLVLDCGENATTSATTVTAEPDHAVVGRPVLLRATVTGSGSTPTGTVTFRNGSGAIVGCAAVALASGTATCTTTFAHTAGSPLSIGADYSGDSTHPGSTGRLSLAVERATPVITWADPAAISYPTALSGTQLNAVADVPGTFSYTVHADGSPAAGSVLHAGDGQLIDATFTPDEPADFTAALTQARISVSKGSQAITVDPVSPASISAGTTMVTARGGPSGQPVQFVSATPSACSVESTSGSGSATNAVIRLLAANTCQLTLNQAGAADWAAAATVGASFVITPAETTRPELDGSVFADQRVAASQITSPALSVSGQGKLVLALVSSDGPSNQTQSVSSVTGGGLTWTLARRSNATWGTAEVWQAYVPGTISSLKVTAKLAKRGYDSSITVAAFKGTASSVSATAAASGTSGAPRVGLTARTTGGLVWAVGHVWNKAQAPVLGAGQALVHGFVDTRVGDTYWVQSANARSAAASVATLNATAPAGRWQLTAVEIGR